MALPDGITTCTVTAGVPVTHTGAPVKAFVSIEPSVFLVHTATGTPLVDFLEELSINEGVAGQFTLPHTDQAGFQDENGNAYTNWYYTARISYSTPSKAKTKAPKIKVFQLATGQTLVDLDALPGGAPALPYTAAIATVTSFAGRTGPVTLQESDLPARLEPASLEATIAAATTGKLDASTAATTYEQKEDAAIGRLFAALSASGTTACNLVFSGSSTTEGTAATTAASRYVNKFVSALQSAFPAPGGTEAATVANMHAAWGTISTTPGVHGYNGGQGGTTSATYMDNTEAASIMSLNPAMVLHMIGSNDYSTNMDPATYKANVQDRVDHLFSLATKPLVQVLVHSYARWDVTGTYAWALYGQALKEIAAATDNVLFIDLSAYYETVQVPGADPYDLVTGDLVHQGDAGHLMMAKLLYRALRLPPATAPGVVASSTEIVRARYTSDNFTGADAPDVHGRTTDASLGGAAKTWTVGDAGITNQVATSGGAMVRGAGALNNFACTIPETAAGVEVGATISALPVGAALNLEVHRAATNTSSTPNCYRAIIDPTGFVSVAKRVSSAVTTLNASATTIVPGDRLSFRHFRGNLELRKNGALAYTVADNAIPGPGYAGISGASPLTAFGVKSVTVDVLT